MPFRHLRAVFSIHLRSRLNPSNRRCNRPTVSRWIRANHTPQIFGPSPSCSCRKRSAKKVERAWAKKELFIDVIDVLKMSSSLDVSLISSEFIVLILIFLFCGFFSSGVASLYYSFLLAWVFSCFASIVQQFNINNRISSHQPAAQHRKAPGVPAASQEPFKVCSL